MLGWMWAHPWSILLVFAVITALALWARRAFHPDYFYERGLRRCNVCPGSNRSRNKVVYDSRSDASTAALRYQRKYGPQTPYRGSCGYWHLTSQSHAIPRRRTLKR